MQSRLSQVQGLDLGLARLNKLAPMGYALGLHIRFASAHIMIQTYPASWIDRYTQNGYIMEQATEHGLLYGIAVSHGEVSSRSIGGFSRADREFTDTEIDHIHQTVRLLHQEATPPQSLTPAQRHALRLVAKGCRHAEAAALLEISESAFKARLKSARERLFVRTTAEAIQRAQEHKLL